MTPRSKKEFNGISFVIPLFNEEGNIALLRQRLGMLASHLGVPCEWVVVNDGSSDGTPNLLNEWAHADDRLKVVHFARNFGQQMAITAGLDVASCDAIVTMDGDLQDPPEVVEKMLERYFSGFDVVYGTRMSREGETIVKRLTAYCFYWLMQNFIHKGMVRDTGDFRLISRRVKDALGAYREGHRFLRGLVASLGFYQTNVLFERPARVHGETKFPMRKMLAFAFDGIMSFSSFPLFLGIYLGCLALISGLCGLGLLLVAGSAFNYSVTEYSILLCVGSIFGGVVLMCLGFIGVYVGKIYDEIKNRPLYVVSESRNLKVANGFSGFRRSSWPEKINSGRDFSSRTENEAS